MELIRNNIDRIERLKEQLKESSYECNKILTDKKTGTVETYEGKYLVRKNYKDGVQHGLHERVHPSGQVMSRGTYFNGQPHGLYEGFQIVPLCSRGSHAVLNNLSKKPIRLAFFGFLLCIDFLF